jgi:hypothetical protein
MATRASNFDPWGLFFEREVGFTCATLQLRRAMVDPGYQHLGARWAGEFLLLPFAAGQRVVNTDSGIAQGAVELAQTNGQHALALRARQCRWRHF